MPINANKRIYFILIFCFICCPFAKGQIPVKLNGLNKKSGVQVVQKNNTLDISWPTGENEKGKIMLDLQPGAPLFKSIQVQKNGLTKK